MTALVDVSPSLGSLRVMEAEDEGRADEEKVDFSPVTRPFRVAHDEPGCVQEAQSTYGHTSPVLPRLAEPFPLLLLSRLTSLVPPQQRQRQSWLHSAL